MYERKRKTYSTAAGDAPVCNLPLQCDVSSQDYSKHFQQLVTHNVIDNLHHSSFFSTLQENRVVSLCLSAIFTSFAGSCLTLASAPQLVVESVPVFEPHSVHSAIIWNMFDLIVMPRKKTPINRSGGFVVLVLWPAHSKQLRSQNKAVKTNDFIPTLENLSGILKSLILFIRPATRWCHI